MACRPTFPPLARRLLRLLAICVPTMGTCCPLTDDCHKYLCDKQGPNSVTSVEIFPSLVYAQPDAKFLWEARPADPLGVPVKGPMKGSWSPPSRVTAKSDDPVLAVVDLPSGSTETYDDFVAEIEGATSEPGTVRVGSTTPGAPEVRVEHVDGDAPAAVLLHGTAPAGLTGLDCGGYVSIAVVGIAAGPELKIPPGCQVEGFVFSRGSGLLVVDEAVTSTNVILDVKKSDLPSERPLDIYFVDRTDGDATADIATDTDGAGGLYDLNRVGISLNPVETRVLEQGPYSFVSTGECDNPDYLAGVLGIPKEELESTEPSAHKLYVAYVRQLDDNGSHPKGKTCPATAGRGPVVLVSVEDGSVTTLPHELGHTLLGEGHNQHVYNDYSNLMSASSEVCHGATRDHVWLGQGFRMNLDMASWLQHGLSTSDVDVLGARTCPAPDQTDGACPARSRDVGDGDGTP